jgi:hypothetical protein
MKIQSYVNHLSLSTLILFLALALSGCANQKTPPPSTEELTKAATEIMMQTAYVAQLVSSCASLGGDAEVIALESQQQWYDSNKSLILAADYYYGSELTDHLFDYNNKKISPAAIKLVSDARARAINELALTQRTPTNQTKTCQFRFNRLKEQEMHIDQLPAIIPYTQELLNRLSQTPVDLPASDLHLIPSVAGGFKGATQGPTYFQISSAHAKTCTNAYTLSIDNQWPIEIYATFCDGALKQIVSCEWGECKTKEQSEAK